jgi:hypothetical protein
MATDRTPPTAQAGLRPASNVRQLIRTRTDRACALLTGRPVSLYAAAVLRIGYGLLYLAFLLREFPHRDEIWGPGSPWTPDLARQLFQQSGWNSVLTLSDNRGYFELCYALAVTTCVLFTLGWRTRAMSVLFAVTVASFHARALFMTDGGDNLTLLMAVYLMPTACGRRWSLDARRTRSPPNRPASSVSAEQLRYVRGTLTTVLHNCGMFVIAAQVCFLYGSAGLYKVQGGSWGNGTALHDVLNLRLFQPWPALSHFADGYPMTLAIAGYVTVMVQVAFPFALFGRLKYPVLAVLIGMHAGIALLLGLPLFSGAMVVADAVFLSDRLYLTLGGLARRAVQRAGAGPAGQRNDRPLPVPSQPAVCPGPPHSPGAPRRSAGSAQAGVPPGIR